MNKQKNKVTPHEAAARSPARPRASAERVIICDDHIAIRSGLTRILEDNKIAVAGECGTTPALLELVRLHPDAVVITDLGIDELPFPALMAKLKKQAADCKVVVYSMREAPATIGLCYEAGATAFVPKSASPEELFQAIKNAVQGEQYFPASVASQLASFHVDKKAPPNILSAREKDIFVGYAKEGTVEALAAKMGVSDKTVQNLLSQIAKKLDAPRSTFHQLARKYGLLD